MESDESHDPYLIHSVSHTGDVARDFTTLTEILRLGDIVSRTAHGKGIALRLLCTLERTGLVEKVGINQYRSTVDERKRHCNVTGGLQGFTFQDMPQRSNPMADAGGRCYNPADQSTGQLSRN